MNYLFQHRGLRVGGNEGLIDYSHHSIDPLNEHDLNESSGLSPGSVVGNLGTQYYCFGDPKSDDSPDSIDWNCDGSIDPNIDSVDINNGEGDVLNGHDDWANLTFRGGSIGGVLGGEPLPSVIPTELDIQEVIELGLLDTVTRPLISAPNIIYVSAAATSNIVLQLSNLGTTTDTFTISLQSDQSWVETNSIETLTIDSEQTIQLELAATPHLEEVGKQALLSVSLTSSTNSNFKDAHFLAIVVVENEDADGDGIANAEDMCPSSEGSTAVNLRGCSISQLCPSERKWRNHGRYVSCVVAKARKFQRRGLITKRERKRIVREATRSNIGRR